MEASGHLERALALNNPQALRSAQTLELRARLAGLQNTTGALEEAGANWVLVLEQAEQIEEVVLPEFLIGFAFNLMRWRQFDTAAVQLERALEAAGDERMKALVLDGMSQLADKRGQSREALDYSRAGLAICQQLGDEQLIGSAYFRYGWALKEVGDFVEAR